MFVIFALATSAQSYGGSLEPDFTPCEPVSDFWETPDGPQIDFCADWNPEFKNNGHRCCSKYIHSRSRKANRCDPKRRKSSFCDEMTDDQKAYSELIASGKGPDVLKAISQYQARNEEQAYCSVNSGFLVWGRRIIPSALNRVSLRTPQRCTDFGTDPMIGLLEWTGRQIAKEYPVPEFSKVHLTLGDIAAPRGGCLTGRSGRRGHASHTSGQDADVGFIYVDPKKPAPVNFNNRFEPKPNWWMIKQIFKNPYACVKVIFLDRRHISKLASVARDDSDWPTYRRFIRHIRGHRNHMHVRIGEGPGQPGCVPNAAPELEPGDEADVESGTGQGANVEQSE